MGAVREFLNDIFGNGGGLRATFAKMMQEDGSDKELQLTPDMEENAEQTPRCRAGFEGLYDRLVKPNNDGGPN